MPSDFETAAEIIRHSPTGHRCEEITEFLQPSIRIGVRRAELSEIPIGVSRFGGVPDLPADIEWPILAGRPMEHLAQIDLATVAQFDKCNLLPRDGWLCFFYYYGDHYVEGFDIQRPYRFKDERVFHVVHFTASQNELRRAQPKEASVGFEHFRPCRVKFQTELTLPNLDSPLIQALQLTEQEKEDYSDLSLFGILDPPPMPSLPDRGWRKWFKWFQSRDCGLHRMLGHPDDYDAAPEVDWQLQAQQTGSLEIRPTVESIEHSREWILLLQLGTDYAPNWMWSDCGVLYFGIRKQDLNTLSFDAVEVVIEAA